MAQDPRGTQQKDGTLAGHFRRGRIYTPSLIAFPEFVLAEWVREDLPDMLWPLILVARHGERGLQRYESLQQAAVTELGTNFLEESVLRFDGRLTALNRVPEGSRARARAFLDGHPQWCPELLRDLANLYDNLPGAWLVCRDGRRDILTPEAAAAVMDDLTDSVMRVATDEHLTALVKMTPITWRVVTRSGEFDPTIVELLQDYPAVPQKHARADVVIGASFGAMKGAEVYQDSDVEAERAKWATDFWQQSRSQTPCVPEESLEASEPAEPNREGSPSRDAGDDQGNHAASLATRLEVIVNDFIEHAIGRDSTFNPYRPAKHEVVTGLFSRAARAVAALVQAPHMWNGEHGMATVRILAETEILLTWMPLQRPEIYERYRQYGRGKRKLFKLHMDDLVASMGSTAPQMLLDASQRLETQVGNEWAQNFQPVSLEPTFSGVTWRQMAHEAGLADLYQYVFQPASGVVHGEWWTIEDHAMQRCLHPLHLFHVIPSFAGASSSDPQIAEYIVRRVNQLSKLAGKALNLEPLPADK
ncbi:MAG TPA: DUF5677 domain-containing protein [Acidimicrobiales bacterium]|jgi:hypothetical protein|nr:DUF5677 domain-containing protein [Acidimicrobiales bacterium]